MDLGCSFPETKSNALPVFIPIRNLPMISNSKSPVGKLAPIRVAAKKARRLFISRAPFLPKEKGVRKAELLKKGTEETPEQVLAHEKVGQQEKRVATWGFQTGNLSSLQGLVHGYYLLRLPSSRSMQAIPAMPLPSHDRAVPRDCQVRPGACWLTKTDRACPLPSTLRRRRKSKGSTPLGMTMLTCPANQP